LFCSVVNEEEVVVLVAAAVVPMATMLGFFLSESKSGLNLPNFARVCSFCLARIEKS
jgi:hypothetical protein